MKRACLCPFLLVAVTMGVHAQAPDEDDGRVQVDFKEMDLDRVLKFVSDELQVRFLYDEKILKRKVNLLSPVDVPRKELMPLLQSILEMQNFTMVQSGGEGSRVWKVVPFTAPIANPANKGGIETYLLDQVDRIPEGDGLVSLVVPLKFVDARSAFIAIQGMASDPRMVQAIESANVVVVTDTAENVARIANIVKLMDTEKPGPEIEVIQLKHADPVDLVNKLTPLLQVWSSVPAPKVPGQPDIPGWSSDRDRSILVADPRTRQIVVFATRARVEQIRGLIQEKLDIGPAPLNPAHIGKPTTCTLEELDQRADDDEVVTLVVPLKNADARDCFIALQGMATDPRLVQAVESTATIMVTDRVSNLRRIASVVRTIEGSQRRPSAFSVESVLVAVDPSVLASLGATEVGSANAGELYAALTSQPREGVRMLLRWGGQVLENREAVTEDSSQAADAPSEGDATARQVRQSLSVGVPAYGKVSIELALRVMRSSPSRVSLDERVTLAGEDGRWLVWGTSSHVGAEAQAHLLFVRVDRLP